MTSLPAPKSPFIDKINAHMAKIGGEPVRCSMRDGRAQFWVVMPSGETTAGSSTGNLMRALKLEATASPAQRDPKWISVKRAAKLSGFSASTLHRFAKLGEIDSTGRRPRWFNPESVTRWSEGQRASANPRRRPRRRRKHNVMPGSVAPTPRRATASGFKFDHGVPIPSKRGNVETIGWGQMKVGDSLFRAGKKRISPPSSLFKKWSFTSRMVTERGVLGCRIWRTK